MTDLEYIRKTFTLTHLEIRMLEYIIKQRHPRGTRRESETIRDLIAEEFERLSNNRRTPK